MKNFWKKLRALIGLAGLTAGAAGCACFGAEANTKEMCVVTNAVIDCGKDEIRRQIEQVKPAITVIMTTRPDAAQLLDGLRRLGLDVLACTVDSVVKDLFSRAGANPESASAAPKAASAARAWKSRNLPNVVVSNLP